MGRNKIYSNHYKAVWARENYDSKKACAKVKKWRLAHPTYGSSYTLQRKQQVIQKYGGQCFCCQETQLAFLTIDHINGKGNVDRRKLGCHWYIRLRDEPLRTDLRVLCMNCNFATRFGKECPHVKKL